MYIYRISQTISHQKLKEADLNKWILLAFSFLVILTGCQNQEISLLGELNDRLAQTSGNVEKAKEVMKNFMVENRQEMRETVQDFKQEPIDEKRDRYLDFNRHFYNRNSLFETLDRYGYLRNKEFDKLFENFKKEMSVFFQEDF
jgi:hypothetical protein